MSSLTAFLESGSEVPFADALFFFALAMCFFLLPFAIRFDSGLDAESVSDVGG